MPILAHTIVRDDPLVHIAWIDYCPPCVVERLASGTGLHWRWSLTFEDPNGDGSAEILKLEVGHFTAPHPGEPAPSTFHPIRFL